MKKVLAILTLIILLSIAIGCESETQDAPLTLTIGNPVYATLGPEAPKIDDKPYYDIPITIENLDIYQFDAFATSDQLDLMMSLILEEGAKEINSDDDSGGNKNPRLKLLLEPGDYIVRTTTYSTTELGSNVSFVILATKTSPVVIPESERDPVAQAGEIMVGDTVDGSITGENVNYRDQFYTDYALTIQDAGTYEISATAVYNVGEGEDAAELDSKLDLKVSILSADATTLYGDDDDSGGDYNPLLVTPLNPGDYIVRLTTFGSDEKGDFTLSVEKVD